MRTPSCIALLLAWLPFLAADATLAAATRPLAVPDSAGPTLSVFTSRDGLSDEIWSTVGMDRDGFIWAGSASGLSRFDGYRWTPHPIPGASSLVRDMASDADGNLWAIFEREGLARYDGRDWHFEAEPRFYQRFSVIQDQGKPELWVGHADGLSRLSNGEWLPDPGNANMPSTAANAIQRTATLFGEPREWLGTATRGLWYRPITSPPSPWQPFDTDGLQDIAVTDLMTTVDANDEALWLSSYGSGVARISDEWVRIWRRDRGELPSEAIYTLAQTRDSDGELTVWMASRGGLLRFRSNEINVFDRSDGLPSSAIRSVKVLNDADGNDLLWLPTEGGMARAALNDNPWRVVSRLGAQENGIFGVLVEPDDKGGERLWVGSSRDGLALLSAGRWRRFQQSTGELPARSIRGIWRLPGPDGREHRLLSLTGAALQEIDDSLQVVPAAAPWGEIIPEDTINHVAARHIDGLVEWWTASSFSGIHRLRDGEWTHYPSPEGPGDWSVFALHEQTTPDGRSWLWAADARGLLRLDGEHWQRLPETLGVSNDGFRAINVLDEGKRQVLWASSNRNGVLRLDVSDPQRPARVAAPTIPVAPDPTVYSVLRDGKGRIYVCTNNGVQQLTPDGKGGYVERVFRRRDGMIHDECNTNAQFIDSHDRYWAGSLAGLGMFDPDTRPPAGSSRKKPLLITAILANNEAHGRPEDGLLALPPGIRDLRVDFSLLGGQRENESRYRSRLIGHDAAFTAWSGEHSRSFGRLSAGDYRLEIEARDFAGIEALPVILEVRVAPFWWQQRWLQLLAIVAAALVLIGAILGYNRGLHRRQRLLRQLVAERTEALREANDRLTELSYLDPLTGIANRRRLMEAIRAAMQRAAEMRKPLGLIVADVDHFKRYNDEYGHLAGDVALKAIAGAMRSTMREQDLVARFGGEEFACLMIDADLELVRRIAERMRALVEALPPRSLGNDSQGMTISAGVVSGIPPLDMPPEALFQIADQALYRAKANGRNRVEVGGGDTLQA
ncbi:MAG: diguanylate cyclase [Lysobacteraceae bacterium]